MEKPTIFVDSPSQLLKCPVCHRIFTDPVISVQCGHTFCRKCVDKPSDHEQRCPMDEKPYKASDLVVNRAVQGQLEELLVHCCHGLSRSDSDDDFVVDDDGCSEVIRLGIRDEHESVCGFALEPCPVGSALCGMIRRQDVEVHVTQCRNIRCPYGTSGCEFRGTVHDVDDHKAVCGFRGLSYVYSAQSSEIKQLREVSEELRRNMHLLVEQMAVLQGEVHAMNSKLDHQEKLVSDLQRENKRISKELELERSRPATTQTLSNEKGVPSPRHLRGHGRSSSLTVNLPRDFNIMGSSMPVALTSSVRSRASSKTDADSWTMPFTFKCIGTFRGHTKGVFCLTSKGQRLYSGSRDGTVRVWDMDEPRRGCLATMKGHTDTVHTLVIGSGHLYSSGADLAIKSWKLDSLEVARKVEKAHENIVSSLVVAGKYLFSASFAEIKVWNALTLEHLCTLEGLNHWVRALAIDEHKEKVYSGSHNKIHMWSTHGEFNQCGKLDVSQGSIYCLAVTRQYIIAGTYNQNIHIYDVNTQQHLKALFGHISTVTDLAVSGHFLCSSSVDTSVQVWNLENMLPIQILKRHEDGVNAVTIHHDYLLSGSEDSEIKIFKYFKT